MTMLMVFYELQTRTVSRNGKTGLKQFNMYVALYKNIESQNTSTPQKNAVSRVFFPSGHMDQQDTSSLFQKCGVLTIHMAM